MHDKPYALALGNLMYAQVYIHPDISFIVGVLGRYLSNPDMDHWIAVKRIMRYLKRTKDYMLIYQRSENLEIIRYSDSDFMAYGCETVTKLHIVDDIERPLKIFCDNKSTILYSNNNKSLTKSKHIDIKFLVVKEKIQEKQISIEHIGTEYMLADPLTKGLIPKVFHEHTARMGVNSCDVLV